MLFIFGVFLLILKSIKADELTDFLQSNYGYPIEKHTVTTEDGYVLTLHRVPAGNDVVTKKGPALISHGLTCSSSDFMILGPNKSLSYILAKEGYDVWLPNARGNSFSNRHLNIPESNSKQFYNFSWHEIGVYDLPASIDYILNYTNTEKLHYFGHSQGGTVFLVMASMKPEYNDRIKLATLMAPGYILDTQDPLMSAEIQNVYNIERITNLMGFYNVPGMGRIRMAINTLCKLSKSLCASIIFTFAGYENEEQFVHEDYILATKFYPSQAALRQLYNFWQTSVADAFQRFDFGEEENLKQYGTSKPPKYDLSRITAPIALYIAPNDALISIEKSKELAEKLQNVVQFYVVPDKKFNHGNFMYAKNIRSVLYEAVIELVNKYN